MGVWFGVGEVGLIIITQNHRSCHQRSLPECNNVFSTRNGYLEKGTNYLEISPSLNCVKNRESELQNKRISGMLNKIMIMMTYFYVETYFYINVFTLLPSNPTHN
jgi:hypothetical protein